MMVLHRKTGKIEHKTFKEIITYFDDKDTFVMNNTKVFPARFMEIRKKPVLKLKFFCFVS